MIANDRDDDDDDDVFCLILCPMSFLTNSVQQIPSWKANRS